MRYLSVCSGIEAATVAWHPLGWTPAAFSEIEAFPRAVLNHHYPEVPCHGDFTTIGADDYGPINLLVGGTPCQSFSVAGLRGGIHDERGNLALEFLRLLDRTRPRWVVWENVPGVFSATSHDAPDFCPPEIDLDANDAPQDGEEVVVEDRYDADESHAFACFLAGLQELGYGAAYRVFDAQYAGVAQRRRRCFVVGHLGDWRRAAAVLFERHSLQGHPAPRREKGQGFAASTCPSLTASGRGVERTGESRGQDPVVAVWPAEIAPTLYARMGDKMGLENQHIDSGAGHFVAPVTVGTLTSNGDAHSGFKDENGPVAFNITPSNSNKDYNARESDRAQALTAGGNRPSARGGDLIATPVAFDTTQITSAANYSNPKEGDPCHPLAAGQHPPAVAFAQNTRDEVREMSVAGALAAEPGMKQQSYIRQASAVRRLTPRECERLQGFPDDYTLVPYRGKPAADGPRYKALGNSMAVPVMRWIGERIALVEALQAQAEAA